MDKSRAFSGMVTFRIKRPLAMRSEIDMKGLSLFSKTSLHLSFLISVVLSPQNNPSTRHGSHSRHLLLLLLKQIESNFSASSMV